jgi:hypothetical protein
MTPGAATESTDRPATPPHRWLRRRGPTWIRVSVITTLVLVGVFLSTMALAALGIGDSSDPGGGHGSRGEMEMGPDGSGRDHASGEDHQSGGGGTSRNHGASDDEGSRSHTTDD